MVHEKTTDNVQKGNSGTQYTLGLISDLDRASKTVTSAGKTAWKGLYLKASLVYDNISKNIDFELGAKEKATVLFSQYSIGGRGMELSELLKFNGRLFSVDDRTGIIYDITEGKAIPWTILCSGDGRQEKGFKGEWMTIKDDQLFIGSHGKEIMKGDTTEILSKDNMWIKVVTKEGAVRHENWEDNYEKMRNEAGYPFPGYLVHEACAWSSVHGEWFFLPRKANTERFRREIDEFKATNLLIRCSEDFSEIKVLKIGVLEERSQSRGFSTFKFIPGTNDEVIVAIKSEEIGDEQRSFLSAFTANGEVLLDDKEFSSSMKFEGLEFL